MEARDMLILRDSDGITMNRRRLLADAKAKALELAKNYEVPKPVEINLPGPTANAAMELAVQGFHQQGKATKQDVVVSLARAKGVSGGKDRKSGVEGKGVVVRGDHGGGRYLKKK